MRHVLMREPIVAMITLCLLNIFVVSAGAAVVNLTPERKLAPRPPAVADRAIVSAGGRTSAASTSAPLPNAGTLAARLAGPMKLAGAPINAVVIDPTTRRTLYDQRSQLALVPASTTKIVTATAALSALGADQRLTTKVVKSSRGVVLVGGGDPTLVGRSEHGFPNFASLPDLAKRTAGALKAAGTRRVRVDYDSSLYEESGGAPGWKPNYLPEGSIAPVTALAVDEGRAIPAICDEDSTTARAPNPPQAAAQTFAQFLTKYGVRASVGSQVKAGPGGRPGQAAEVGGAGWPGKDSRGNTAVRQVAAVRSPPVRALVEHMLECSDNDLAEALARQVAIERHRTPDFAGASQAVHEVLSGLGVADGVQVYDGSGLSVRNRITPAALAKIVALAASDREPTLRSVITGMPIAGFSGTLEDRYDADTTQMGAGSVRAKTGTLSNVSTLAGLVYDTDGRILAFAFMVNKVKSVATARFALDRLASTVAACGCRG